MKKYDFFKGEFLKPENKRAFNKLKADFSNYVRLVSSLKLLVEGLNFNDESFDVTHYSLTPYDQEQHMLDAVWECFVISNSHKYLDLQHQPILTGWVIYTKWGNNTFFGKDNSLQNSVLNEATIVGSYEFAVDKILPKAKKSYPELDWEVIPIKVEWSKK